MALCVSTSRSKRLQPSPLALAVAELTIGGSCLWSPMSTTCLRRFSLHSASSAGSVLCVVSSTTIRSNSSLRSISLAGSVLVAHTSFAAATRHAHSAAGYACNSRSLCAGSVESAPTRRGKLQRSRRDALRQHVHRDVGEGRHQHIGPLELKAALLAPLAPQKLLYDGRRHRGRHVRLARARRALDQRQRAAQR